MLELLFCSSMEATNRVYIGNLDPSVTQQEMEAETRRFGQTISVWVARSPPGMTRTKARDVCNFVRG